MVNQKLESMVVNIPDNIKPNPLEQPQETLRLATEVVNEIERAKVKLQSITQIDGHPIFITGLSMRGKTDVEYIGITYYSNEVIHTIEYSKQEFYEL